MLNTRVIISNPLNGKLLSCADKEDAVKMTSSARIGAQEPLKKHRNDNDMANQRRASLSEKFSKKPQILIDDSVEADNDAT